MTINEIKQSKSDKQWQRLYNAYIKNYNKLSERLNGNVYDAMSFVEYKDTYANLYLGGIRQNITRTIVAKEAIVSTKQARVASYVLFNMAIAAQGKLHNGDEVTLAETYIMEYFKQFKGSRYNMQNYLRKNPDLIDLLSKSSQELGKSWTEYIPSP